MDVKNKLNIFCILISREFLNINRNVENNLLLKSQFTGEFKL